MSKEQQAEYLKERVYEIMNSKKISKINPDKKIVTVHVEAELFLSMAYLFIAKHG